MPTWLGSTQFSKAAQKSHDVTNSCSIQLPLAAKDENVCVYPFPSLPGSKNSGFDSCERVDLMTNLAASMPGQSVAWILLTSHFQLDTAHLELRLSES